MATETGVPRLGCLNVLALAVALGCGWALLAPGWKAGNWVAVFVSLVVGLALVPVLVTLVVFILGGSFALTVWFLGLEVSAPGDQGGEPRPVSTAVRARRWGASLVLLLLWGKAWLVFGRPEFEAARTSYEALKVIGFFLFMPTAVVFLCNLSRLERLAEGRRRANRSLGLRAPGSRRPPS